jgi:hypothetical protein
MVKKYPTPKVGERFGSRIIVSDQERADSRCSRLVQVACDCGDVSWVQVTKLYLGRADRCNPCHLQAIVTQRMLASSTHGHSPKGRVSRTYSSWRSMKSRCTRSNHVSYPHYGGRGITYAPRWESFENFLADMGERPEGTSLDRINPDGNYEPGNVRWASAAVQRKNRRAA